MDGSHGSKKPRRPIRIVAFAAPGARTHLGDEVVSASGTVGNLGRRIALAGGVVRHPELGDALITTSESPVRSKGRPLAPVGSLASREGEFVLDGGQRCFALLEYEDGWIEGRGLNSNQDRVP
ncbi:hypothetical protein ASG87_16595 [Frateuria sp. Soil773]|uniref:hypothetical protein n=1 Tax=Frateuria sp. Soil773 TaxID=1736407 RepID=UPI0006F682D1|nr:hypothetical protein [Frateuria sp. Soil773]KRE96605.1 hypothetical protein ASG87_16595 [Frateuria sp. Soil773]